MATPIGLGTGVGYALFVVTRHCGNIKAGMFPQDAATFGLNISGRAGAVADMTAEKQQLVAADPGIPGVRHRACLPPGQRLPGHGSQHTP